MTTKVHVWSSATSDVGHVSLTIGNEYMSFWPSEAAGKKDFKIGQSHVPAFPGSYRVDCRLERRECDQSVILDRLDEDSMIKAWHSFKTDKANKYNMVNKNCSTVAAWLLEIGSNVSPFINKGVHIDRWVSDPAQRLLLKLRFLGNHIDMWTPDDVLRYAMKIKSTLGS